MALLGRIAEAIFRATIPPRSPAADQVFLHIEEDEPTVFFPKGDTTFLSTISAGKMILIHSTLVSDANTRAKRWTTMGVSMFHPGLEYLCLYVGWQYPACPVPYFGGACSEEGAALVRASMALGTNRSEKPAIKAQMMALAASRLVAGEAMASSNCKET